MSISDRELWAAADMVMRRHGTDAPLFVAERIGALALAGDGAGMDAWRAIAARISRLNETAAASGSTS